MRIGVVTTSYPRAPDDAAGNFVAAHVDWLLARGHEVDVVCAGDAARAHESWQPGASITVVPADRGLFYRGGAPDAFERGSGLLSALRFSGSMTVALAKRIRSWDAAFAHWLVPSAVTLSLLQHTARCSRRCQALGGSVIIPTVAIAHSGDVHLLRQLRATELCARALHPSRTPIAFVSHALREQFLDDIQSTPLRHWLRAHSLVTPMGIDVARFRPLRRPPARAHDILRLAFIGRLVPIKGVSVLLDAIHQLDRFWPHPIEVTIAGHGPERARLERHSPGRNARVQFTGELTTHERDQLLARTDLLVLPSLPRSGGRTEGTPVTALEAMAAGVPVIASRTGGLAEIPDDAITLVPPGDAHALALAIRDTAGLHPRRERQVHVAIRHAESLDWALVGERLFSLMTDPTC